MGLKEVFDKQFDDYVVEVSEQEIQVREDQDKPIHYISMHGVENPGSAPGHKLNTGRQSMICGPRAPIA